MNTARNPGAACRERGMTLVELAISLAVTGILVGMGIPAFSEWRSRTELQTTADLLLTHLQMARSHAVTAVTPVMVCPADGGCTESDWSRGWIVFEDGNDNRRRDPGEDLIVEHRLDGDLAVDWRRSPSWFSYHHTGIGWPNGTFRVCRRPGTAAGAAVVVSLSGRPRLAAAPETRACRSL